VLHGGNFYAIARDRGAERGGGNVAHVRFDLDGLGEIGAREADTAVGASGMQREGNSFTGMQPDTGERYGLTQGLLILHTYTT
jgi:hypothetical protein